VKRPCGVNSAHSYSAGLSSVKATGTAMLTTMRFAGISSNRIEVRASLPSTFERLGDEISNWADNEDSIAAFAECTVVGWKP